MRLATSGLFASAGEFDQPASKPKALAHFCVVRSTGYLQISTALVPGAISGVYVAEIAVIFVFLSAGVFLIWGEIRGLDGDRRNEGRSQLLISNPEFLEGGLQKGGVELDILAGLSGKRLFRASSR